MNEYEDKSKGDEAEAPGRLKGDIRALFAFDIPVPAEADERVLSLAKARMRRARVRRVIVRWATATAAAAAVIIGVLVLPSWRESGENQPAVASATREDIDGNGQVDILDAFALARGIEASTVEAATGDMNRDGAVNQADVDIVAMTAVSLDRGVM